MAGPDDVYAPGDAGDFPVKQAFLAFLQADAVADHIAATSTGAPFAQPFDPVSMCVMEMFDTATFAQVPLEMTGDPPRRSGAARRRRRLPRRHLAGLAAGQEDARLHRAGALRRASRSTRAACGR